MTTSQSTIKPSATLTWIDPFEVDLPGELDNIIPFPSTWEPDPEPPAACALCAADGADAETGLCRVCAERLPRVGGCGVALRVVAGITAGSNGGALAHLTDCPDCRAFFGLLAETAWAADVDAAIAEERIAA